MAETLEDALIAQGLEVAAHYPCERCSRQVAPFAMLRSGDVFLCTGCLTDLARETTAAAEAADLTIACDRKWAEIKEARQRAEGAGVDIGLGHMQSDADSRRRVFEAMPFAQTALAEGQAYSRLWTMTDNTNVPHSAEQIIAAGKAMDALTAACNNTAQALRAQIETAETIAAIDAIAWPVPPEGE
ncbi:DUF4376 domain-containing protein [Sphingomonas cavernae]|uniref:DUF4376 domain-containing protein n=1 Tax=Sphingomonas cavernae TaxID=2320861 RepID=A0A418WMC1_9SPHN|nr:DUF4376 domain-containing protein [Sphingomonas cavernae]RJF91141.1 DUF4376 domain-containing protein [Sphingomonas cavernae]